MTTKQYIRFSIKFIFTPLILPVWIICEWLEEEEMSIRDASKKAYNLLWD